MTDAELAAIEARAADAQLMPGAWSGYANTDRKALVAEVRRLRGLIKWAEATPHRGRGCCLWCGHDVNGEYVNNHRGDCMAFMRDGTPR